MRSCDLRRELKSSLERFPHSQGGAYSVFQDWSNGGVCQLPQDINVTPVTVHPEIGIQNNMVVTQNTEERRVTYSRVPLQQQEYRSQRLYHQQESQATIIGTGFQPPRPRDGVCIFQNMQMSRKDHDFYSSAHVTAQHSRYFGTLAYENSVRQSDSNSGQRKEYSKQNASWHFKKKSHRNHDTGPQQSQDKDQCSSVAVCNNITPSPLLEALLKTNSSELPCSEETNGNIELNANNNFLNKKRHSTYLQVKSLLNALNCGQTRTENLDYSRGTSATPYQQQVSSHCISSWPSKDKLVSAGKTHPPTDIEIQDFVAQKLVYFRSILRLKNNNPGHSNNDLDRNSTLQPDRIKPKVDSVAHLPTTSAKDVDSQSQNCDANEQCKVGQALKQDSSNDSKVNAKSILKAKDTGDCATSASEKHSKGTAVSVVEHSKNPLKNASVDKSASDFDLSVKKHLDATMPADDNCKHVCSDDCEVETYVKKEYGFYSKGCDKYIQNGLTTIHYSLTALKELIASLENVEDIVEMENLSKVILQQYWNGNIDNIHLFTSTEYPRIMMDVAATCTKNEDKSPVVLTAVHEMAWDELTEKEESLPDVSEDLQTKSSSEASENKTFKLLTLIENQDTKEKGNIEAQQCCDTWKERNPHSKLNSAVDSIQIHNVVSLLINQSEGASEDARSVRLQTDLSTGHSENNEQAPLSESRVGEIVKNPLYEDISDDDPSQPATNLTTTEQFLSAGSEDPQYQYISEAESPQRESMAVETSSPAQVTAPNNTQSSFSNGNYGHLQGHTQTNTVTISDELVPKKQVLPDTETQEKAHCSYTFVETGPLCDSGPFSEYETDDDDWLFIPVSISDLTFKSHNEDQDSPERRVLDGGERQCDTSPTYWTSPKPLPASSSQIETFDTLESLKQAFSKRFGLAVAGSTPELEMDSEGKLETTDNRIESLDSCETEDSCDYSSASEHYLTVSRMRSALLPSDMIDSEGEDNVTNMPISPNIPKNVDIIILDSEDDSDQNCSNPQAPQHQPVHHDTPFEEVMQDACSDLSPSTETIGQLIETKAASAHAKCKTKRKRISKKDTVVIIDSDSDTDNDQNYETPRKKRILSSRSDSGDVLSVEQNQHSPKTVTREYRPAKEKLQETKLSFGNSSLPQPQSKLHDTQLKDLTQDACSDPSGYREKSGKLIEAKCGSEHVQHKTSRQKKNVCDSGKVVEKSNFRKKKAKTKGILSSGSENSGDSLCATKNRPSTETVEHFSGTANGKHKKSRLSSDESSEKQPKSVGGEAESTLGHNPVIPCFILKKPPQHDQNWTFSEDPAVHRQDKDGSQSPKTSTAFSNNTDSRRIKKVRFMLPLKPANDNPHTADNIQANLKPRTISRQHSLPSSSRLSSTIEQLSEARQSSVSRARSNSLPTVKQSTSILKPSSSLQPTHSPTKDPSSGTMQSLGNKRAKEIWKNSYIPTRKDKRTTNDSKKAPRPNRRLKQKSKKSSTPLMEKSKIEAIGMTKAAAIEMAKAAGRNPPAEQRRIVGDNYKWSKKSNVAKPTKGSSRQGIQYRPPPKSHR